MPLYLVCLGRRLEKEKADREEMSEGVGEGGLEKSGGTDFFILLLGQTGLEDRKHSHKLAKTVIKFPDKKIIVYNLCLTTV